MAHDNFIDKRRRQLNLNNVHIEDVLPEHFGSSYPKFVKLLERYYEWQDQYDSTELLSHLFASRDITETDLTLLGFIEDELLLGGSYFEGSNDKRAAANFSSVLFRAKGSKYSIEWFFRSFFNLDPEIFYTKENVFLLADEKNPNSFISRIGPNSLRYLTNDKLYQTFALLVRAGIPVTDWKNPFKLFVHPAGMYLGGEVILEGTADLSLTAQGSGETTALPSPIVQLTPTFEPVDEGLTVTYTVGAGVNSDPAQTYLYPGEYKWYAEFVTDGTYPAVEQADFTAPLPLLLTFTPTLVEDANEGDTVLFIDADPSSWLGYDIVGLGIPRGANIVDAVGAPTNTLTLPEPLTQDLPSGSTFTVTGGWQALPVEVKSELPIAGPNAADVPNKVYDTPTSGNISFTIANDFFLNAEGLETFKIHILDWCNVPVRKSVLDNHYYINDVHYTISTTSVIEDTGETIAISGTNLPNNTIEYYLVNVSTDADDWDASQVNAFGFANRQSVTISGNTGTITINPKKDYITEGSQTFRVHLIGDATYGTDVELLEYLNPAVPAEQGALVTLLDTSIYPRYNVSAANITEGSDITATISTIAGTPNSGDGSEHNPNGDVLFGTTDGVLWEILDDLDGRITTTTGRIAFNAASQTPTLSTSTEDGYYRGTAQSTVRITNHDGITSEDTFNMVDAAPTNANISGPFQLAEGSTGNWSFTIDNGVPGTNYYWEVVGVQDADFTTTPPRTGSRGVLTVDSTANSVSASMDTMVMTSTMDLSIAVDTLVEPSEAFDIKVYDAATGGTELVAYNVAITDQIVEYNAIAPASQTVIEGNDISFTVTAVASGGTAYENFNWTITDDGTGRYATSGTITAAAFTSGGGSVTVDVPTSVSTVINGTQNLTIDGTGATYGQSPSATGAVTLNDAAAVYELDVDNTSLAENSGGTFTFDMGATSANIPDGSYNFWLIAPASGTSAVFTGGSRDVSYDSGDAPISSARLAVTITDNQISAVDGSAATSIAIDVLDDAIVDGNVGFRGVIGTTGGSALDTTADLTITDDDGITYTLELYDNALRTVPEATTFVEGDTIYGRVAVSASGPSETVTVRFQANSDVRLTSASAPSNNITTFTNTGAGDYDFTFVIPSNDNFQGSTAVTIEATSTEASDSQAITINDETAALLSVTGLDSLNDGGAGSNFTFAIAPNFISAVAKGSPYESSSSILIKSDGDFTLTNNVNTIGSGGFDSITPGVGAGNWVSSADQTAGFGDDYQVRVLSYSTNPSGFGSGNLTAFGVSGSGSSNNNQGGSTTWDNGTGDWFRLNSDFSLIIATTADASSFIERFRWIDIEIKEFDGSNYGTGTTVLQKRIEFEVSAGGGSP